MIFSIDLPYDQTSLTMVYARSTLMETSSVLSAVKLSSSKRVL